MKALKIIAHPLVLTISFLFLLISGEHFGGFYLLYLLLALPHGGIHVMLAISGIFILIFNYVKFKRKGKNVFEIATNISGTVCLILSLAFFFANDKQGYNDETFKQLIPLITFVLFGVFIIAFLLDNIIRYFEKNPVNDNLSLR